MLNIIKCQVCNNEFEQKQGAIFCSYACSNKSRGFFFTNPVFCEWCKKKIDRPSPSKTHRFCSKQCEMDWKRKDRVEIECRVCKKKLMIQPSQKNRKYCSRKCMGVVVRETHRGFCPQYRSYGECAMVVLLKKNYPQLDLIPNDRIQLDGFEMDIWIPSLKTGIEYNGQHHFKPVYGEKVFKKTQNSDKAKKAISHRKGLKLIYVFPDGTVSKTTKTKIQNLFMKCCKDLKLETPTVLNFSVEEVIEEQKRKTIK